LIPLGVILDGDSFRISFCSPLRGSRLVATDLRGGMSLVLAGLVAEGTTEINGIAHIDRGYDSFEMKLQFLGADVKRSVPLAC
jgi:UDP-N-acetylglucosamine enolpyruvyl transferase